MGISFQPAAAEAAQLPWYQQGKKSGTRSHSANMQILEAAAAAAVAGLVIKKRAREITGMLKKGGLLGKIAAGFNLN